MNSHKGFTLIEVLTVLAIFGILTAISVPTFSGLQTHIRLQTACRELATDLRRTRDMALFKQTEYRISFDSPDRAYNLPWNTKKRPERIVFGYAPDVQGPPSDPQPLSDPDGIYFFQNRSQFHPNGSNSLGTLYLTTGRETMAITLAITGRVKIWQWRDGGWE